MSTATGAAAASIRPASHSVGSKLQPDLVTTAPFAYIRMHAGAGPGGGFTDDQLRARAGRLRGLRRAGREVYIYSNNDWEGHACAMPRACGPSWV